MLPKSDANKNWHGYLSILLCFSLSLLFTSIFTCQLLALPLSLLLKLNPDWCNLCRDHSLGIIHSPSDSLNSLPGSRTYPDHRPKGSQRFYPSALRFFLGSVTLACGASPELRFLFWLLGSCLLLETQYPFKVQFWSLEPEWVSLLLSPCSHLSPYMRDLEERKQRSSWAGTHEPPL